MVRARAWRLTGVGVVTGLWVALIGWRLLSLQVTERTRWEEWAVKQHLAEVTLAPERGPIFDRNGRLLAVSVPAGSVYVRPGQVRDQETAIRELSSALRMQPKEVESRLRKPSPFVWLARQIPRATAEKVMNLKLPGVGFVVEAKRYYPFNHAASALVGRVGVDGEGLSGLERKFDGILRGPEVTTTARRDALGKLIDASPPEEGAYEVPRGNSLALTIDATLQTILDEELENGRREARAKATLGVLIDAETGEVLAMGQSPALNFNRDRVTSRDDLKNLVLETVFEPGSVLKPLIAAAALDAKVVTLSEELDCGNGRMIVGRNTIKDVHPYDRLSLFDVLVRSSNIGMSRLGFRLGKERLYQSLVNLGFGSGVGFSLPGMTDGILRHYSNWAEIDAATHSFGHGLAVTPLQVVKAISAIANGGYLPEATIIAGDLPPEPQRVFSKASADAVRDMMYAVVEDKKGTGRKAAIPGVRVGGKTGTAEKPKANGRGYEDGKYVASFVGFVDGTPLGVGRTLTLMVAVDEPNAGSIYGGVLAAPIFQRTMQRALHTLSTSQQLRRAKSPRFHATLVSR